MSLTARRVNSFSYRLSLVGGNPAELFIYNVGSGERKYLEQRVARIGSREDLLLFHRVLEQVVSKKNPSEPISQAKLSERERFENILKPVNMEKFS